MTRWRALSALPVALLLAALIAAGATACVIEPPLNDERETSGDCNAGAPYLEVCLVGDPVNAATGNLTEQQSDLVVAGRGPGLMLTRSYDSRAASEAEAPGAWGYGWSGSYGAHLEFNAEAETATVIQDNGAAVLFSLEGGEYVAGEWVQASLAVEGEDFVYTLPGEGQLKFDSEGRLSEQVDRNGNAVTMGYAEGKLQTVEDDAGRKLTFAYLGAQVKSVEDPMGHKAEYTYEGGELATVTLPGEEAPRWEFEYDGSHRLTELTDGRGNTTVNEYDGLGRVETQVDALSRERKFAYGETGGLRKTTITEPNGSTTVEKFNAAGEPLTITRASGTALAATTTNAYDGAYRLIETVDPLGHVTIYGYDAAGNRKSEWDPEGNAVKWTYNATHDLITTTTPRGETTTIERDANGNPESIERPGPKSTTQKTTFVYDENGDLTSETDSLEHTTSFEYDPAGNREAEINAEGDRRTWVHDENGLVIAEVSPRGNEEGAEPAEFTTEIERDAQGRPLEVIDPLGHTTKFAYDGNGNLETLTDGNGHVTEYTYDKADQRTKVKAANGTSTETAYDSMGAVKSRTDGNGKTTKYERDALGLITEVIDPLERKTTREYDDAGNLEKLKDPEGRTTTYSYDKADRLKKVSYSETATKTVEYEYDKDGNVTAMKDGTGTSKYAFDQLGRLTEAENGNKEVVKYEYDLGERQTKITYPNGKSVSREFDKANRLVKVTDWLSGSTSFAHNGDSQVELTTFPSGTTNKDAYEYDAAGQLSKTTMSRGEATLASLSYPRDKVGQLESVTQTGLPGAETTAYEYDKADRLTKGGATAYEYDGASNPTKIGAATLKYDSASQLESGGGAAFTFDKLGERTKATPEVGPATTYGYDQAGNLISVARSAEGEVPKIEDAYAYDGNGLRASQTISGTKKQLTWDASAELPLLLYDGTSYYLYGPDGLPFAQIASETPTYLHHDQQGSTRLLTNSSGEAKGAYAYTPYGAIAEHTGTATTPLGYAGQYRNDSTGMLYLRARVYDPATAQFMSADPLSEETGEVYGYARQNPLNWSDPGGECACQIGGGGPAIGGPPVAGAPAKKYPVVMHYKYYVYDNFVDKLFRSKTYVTGFYRKDLMVDASFFTGKWEKVVDRKDPKNPVIWWRRAKGGSGPLGFPVPGKVMDFDAWDWYQGDMIPVCPRK